METKEESLKQYKIYLESLSKEEIINTIIEGIRDEKILMLN